MTIEYMSYGWNDAEATCAHAYLLPTVLRLVHGVSDGKPLRVLDLGCGNGYVTVKLAKLGHRTIGIDASTDGIAIACSAYSGVEFRVGSIYDKDLADAVGEVECVVSLEVVEHLFEPKKLFEQSWRVLKRGGHLIVSTPYHGYLKNLAISLVKGWDRHFKVEWDGGHIKFFSKRTLAQMACNAGFRDPRFHGVGRLPWLWKSMIMVVQK